MSKYDQTEVKEMMRRNAALIAEHLYEGCVLRRDGRNFFTGDVFGTTPTKKGSFMITVEGPNAGFVKEFGKNKTDFEPTSLIDCWIARKNVDYNTAIHQMAVFMGVKPAFGIRSAGAARSRVEQTSGALPERKFEDFKYPEVALGRKVFSDHQRLMRSEQVKAYFNNTRGIGDDVLGKFQVGFQNFEYREKDDEDKETGKFWADTAIFRLRASNGDFLEHTSRLVIPGVTQGNSEKIASKGWCNYTPMAYFSDPYLGQPFLMICEGPKDLWRQYQALVDHGLEKHFLLVTSSHGSAMPRDLMLENSQRNPHYDPDFFSRFKAVFCGHDNDSAGNKMAYAWCKLSGRECLRLSVPEEVLSDKDFEAGESGADWTDFWQAGATLSDFRTLVKSSVRIQPTDYDLIYQNKRRVSESISHPENRG